MKSPRAVMVHNKAKKYRIPLFEGLSNKLSLTILFFAQDDAGESILRDSNVLWESAKNFKFIRRLVNGKYDVLITGDVIHPQAYIAAIIFKVMRKPVILWTESWGGFKKKTLIELASRFLVMLCKAYIVPGIKSNEFLLRIGARRNSIFVSSNPSQLPPTQQSQRSDLRKSMQLDSKVVILFVGRLIKAKGLEYLIRAAAMLEREGLDFMLLIGGEGSIGENLRKQVKQLALNSVRFLGWIDKEKGNYFELADIFVLPSVADEYGLVLVEAAMAGKPIVTTTGAGGAFDIVQKEVNGFIVERANDIALYNAIKRLIVNPTTRMQMGRASKAIANEISFSRMVDSFNDAISYCLKS